MRKSQRVRLLQIKFSVPAHSEPSEKFPLLKLPRLDYLLLEATRLFQPLLRLSYTYFGHQQQFDSQPHYSREPFLTDRPQGPLARC